MAVSNKYQDFLRAKVKGAIAEAQAASNLSHQGVKGTILEILISKLFRPLLPSDIGVGTGQIIESYSGKTSNQIDIILYDKSILPPVLFDEYTGIFPVEAVLYTIEVKTTLTKQDLRVAHESAKVVRHFGFLPGLEDENGKESHHSVEPVRSVVFALNSTLKGEKLKECERYKSIYLNEDPAFAFIRSICVAGKSYCYDSGTHWIQVDGNDEHDEILSFIGGVTNTYRNVARSRHSPNLGNYIIPNTEFKSITASREINSISVVCNGCGKIELAKPVFKVRNTTVSSINIEENCDCGGKFESRKGTFEIADFTLAENYG
ncbi:hypothetical protein K6U55_08540 [Vibrio diabolicus]|uniref:DUF6602 domain-containing protein n=1 Tax=Vibrio diabolicus TaxID=50719 RepID=UPI00211AFDCF|nr:DUF6602 domain-containing protein [Vibrio diabolicus]MCG6242081.1 hypothetical protein [Vibrio diabolicus]